MVLLCYYQTLVVDLQVKGLLGKILSWSGIPHFFQLRIFEELAPLCLHYSILL